MAESGYPPMITRLPEAEVPVPGVRAWISQGVEGQVAFFDIEPGGEVPLHSHGEQWGIVVSGKLELTIGGDTRVYEAGGSYYIGDGVVHSANCLTDVAAIDFFADPERYKPL